MITDVAKSQRQQDTERILQSLQPPAATRSVLVVMVGLPGVGKTHIAGELRRRTGAVVLESDACRALLFANRTYAKSESRRLFAAINGAVDALLARGTKVIVDATNVAEREREPLYMLAERNGAKLVIVSVVAPEHLARERLHRRTGEVTLSEAGSDVYDRMQWRVEAIRRPHFVIHTSDRIKLALDALIKEIKQ